MAPKVRSFEARDVARVHEMGITVPEFAAGPEHRFWPQATLERFAEQGLSCVVEDATDVVGFLLASYQPITEKLTWDNMYLASGYRGQGLADVCFQESWRRAQLQGAKIAESWIARDNDPSQKMLKRLGFQDCGTYRWMLKFAK